MSYYRLKQTDFNGQTEVFDAVEVNCSNETSQIEISYYPNPFTTEVNVVVNNSVSDNATINVYNILGSKVFSKSVSQDEMQLKTFTLDLAGLSNGVCFVEYKSDSYSGVTKMVKH